MVLDLRSKRTTPAIEFAGLMPARMQVFGKEGVPRNDFAGLALAMVRDLHEACLQSSLRNYTCEHAWAGRLKTMCLRPAVQDFCLQ